MSYDGLPVLKPPVWTWQVPASFFVGGAAGAAAVIGAVGARPAVRRWPAGPTGRQRMR